MALFTYSSFPYSTAIVLEVEPCIYLNTVQGNLHYSMHAKYGFQRGELIDPAIITSPTITSKEEIDIHNLH